jgi:hypothetical protein
MSIEGAVQNPKKKSCYQYQSNCGSGVRTALSQWPTERRDSRRPAMKESEMLVCAWCAAYRYGMVVNTRATMNTRSKRADRNWEGLFARTRMGKMYIHHNIKVRESTMLFSSFSWSLCEKSEVYRHSCIRGQSWTRWCHNNIISRIINMLPDPLRIEFVIIPHPLRWLFPEQATY